MADGKTTLVQDLATIEGILKTDLIGALGGPLIAFLSSMVKTPTPLNGAAQWVALQGAIIGQGPALQGEVIQQLSQFFLTKIQTAITAAQGGAPASG